MRLYTPGCKLLKVKMPCTLEVAVVVPSVAVPCIFVSVSVAETTGAVPAAGRTDALPCTNPAWIAKAEITRRTIAAADTARFDKMPKNVFIRTVNKGLPAYQTTKTFRAPWFDNSAIIHRVWLNGSRQKFGSEQTEPSYSDWCNTNRIHSLIG